MRPALRVIEGGAAAPPSTTRALEMMAAGAGLTLVFTLAAALPSWASELGRLQALLAVAFGFFALALWRSPRWRGLPHAGLAVFVIALAMRLAVARVTPTLSDDIWRYVWDGRVFAHGIDPWAHAPADTALAALRDARVHPRINHPDLRTIYPPLAEAGFALVSLLAPGVGGVKSWIVLHDLALVAVLVRWSTRRTGSALPVIAYAWNPLIVLEYAGSAHHDPTGILWLVLALYWLETRPLASAAAFAAAVMVKLAPLVALPLLLPLWPWRARALVLGLLTAGLAFFWVHARGPASGLEAYAAHWRNNELVFAGLAAWLGESRARGAAAVAVVLTAALLLWRRTDVARATRGLLRTALLVGPVVHPWYLGWPLALEPLSPSWPWLLFSALAPLAYGVLGPPAEGGSFHLSLAWRALEYGLPAALAAALAARAAWRARSAR